VKKFSDRWYFIDKSFQRNLVWSRKKQENYIQSVADGTASSSMIVADIDTAIDESRRCSELAGDDFLTKIKKDGYRLLSLDGMQRRDTILKFVHGQISLDVKIRDSDGRLWSCGGKYFKDFPLSVQQSFLHCRVHVVIHEDTPYSRCPKIFRGINDGAALNDQEWRTAIITPVSNTIRTLAETTYADVFPNIEGFNPDKIRRMLDSQTLLHMFMELMPEINEKDFVSKEHCNKFYFLGENRGEMSNVPEYVNYGQAANIIAMAMKCFRQQRTGLAKIPKKTMWAVLYMCREIYQKNLTVTNYDELFKAVRKCDNHLNSTSKMDQGRDILTTQKAKKCTPEDAEKLHPDDNYYWRWINRNAAAKFRNHRISKLIPEVNKQLHSFAVNKKKKAA
jgi:hypothetical protein